MPNRFELTLTPKHGSWLNLIEVFFLGHTDQESHQGWLNHDPPQSLS